ncbi:DNA mismatch endonuclease Vsr [Cellulomonas persica]
MSLFSGIAGLDLGLERAGLRIDQMCEVWEPARRVLQHHFPAIGVAGDVEHFTPTGEYEVLVAGFPCTDVSHAGSKAGIFGERSGLVRHVFRIAEETRPDWVVLENVPNLLVLHRGAGIRHVTHELERLGYRWAYRTVDSRAFGVPQRRPRVIIVASRTNDPAAVLLHGDVTELPAPSDDSSGFYWTEGRHGLGLVRGAIPTLKGGSTIGLPSAPAVWLPSAPIGRRFVLPRVEDGEALQGLPRGWTSPAVADGERDQRWKLIGNAVTVGVGHWLGTRIRTVHVGADTRSVEPSLGAPIDRSRPWPMAGAGDETTARQALVGSWPQSLPIAPLSSVVDGLAAAPLSHRATAGFLSRLEESGRAVPDDFYRDLETHLNVTRPLLPRDRRGAEWVTTASTRNRMHRQRRRDTRPEVTLRRQLRALGLGYRLQMRPEASMRARLDIVFPGAKVAVDVRGCFWHACPQHATSPSANAERWADKLARNVARDKRTVESLEAAGWAVVVVWEHEDPVVAAAHIDAIVRARRMRRPGTLTVAPGLGVSETRAAG